MQSRTKRNLLFAAKLALAVGIEVEIFKRVLAHENIDQLWHRVADLRWEYIGLAAASLLVAIVFGVLRWRLLLIGQGIRAPFRHLFGSWMIGRFFGAVTPGGLGLNGYRLYDIAVRTSKTARSTAVVGIELVLGWLAFGAVVLAGSGFGVKKLGVDWIVGVDLFFGVFMVAAIVLLSRPVLFQWLADRLPTTWRTRLRTLVQAVCAYQGRTGMLAQASLYGVGVHFFNNFIYVFTAMALGIHLAPGIVFFITSLQIFSTLLPVTPGGVGLREGTAAFFYQMIGGVPLGVAVLIPIVGITVEYSISALGGLWLLARRENYEPEITVEEPEREELAHAEIPAVPEEQWPKPARAAWLGLGAGLVAGAIVGTAEGILVLATGHVSTEYGVVAYGATAYGLLCGVGGAALAVALAWSGRWMKRAAMEPARAYGHLVAFMVSALVFALGAFRVRRDVFHEDLAWKSPEGVGVLVACLAAAAILYLVFTFGVRWLASHRPARGLLRPWGSPVAVGALVAILSVGGMLLGRPAKAETVVTRPAPPAKAGNVLLVVVDALRADALPAYGYSKGHTPNLDSFAKDAIRFSHDFSNASWTRPSFASILTGRYPASHKVMGKFDPLSDSLVTMAEAFRAGGYHTAGFVTNFNIAPYFNFQQGFDTYTYLEPNYVLGANDTASKLLFVAALRHTIEKIRGTQPGLAYQDAATMDRAALQWIDNKPKSPFFLFVAYMDPHDPYFAHPYKGQGYSRAAHQHPDPSMAPKLRKLYDGEITYWDHNFGRLIADLKKRGFYDDMTIVVTADHGEEFMDHGGFWHGDTLYDEVTHVPLYVKLPGNRMGGTVADQWVESVDLMPTLLKENGVEVPKHVQGSDLFVGNTDIYAEENFEGNILQSLRTHAGGKELKMITANAGNPRGLPTKSLFDMVRDPKERDNLAGHSAETAAVEKRLADVAAQAKKGAVVKPDTDVQLDANAAARLKSLGYAE